MRSNTGKNIKLKTGKSNLDIVKSYIDGERAFVQVGYDENSQLSSRKEGEEWEDSQGKTWIKQNGVKKRVSKKSIINIEQKCSICEADMKWGNYLDQRVYPRCGKCYDCSIIFDDRLKLLGVFNEYARYTVFKNQLSKLNDIKSKLQESIDYLENYDSSLKYYNSDGTHEVWTDNTDTREKVLTDLRKDMTEVDDRLKETHEALSQISYDSSVEEKEKQMTLESLKAKEKMKFDTL